MLKSGKKEEENLAELCLCPRVLWQVEFSGSKIEYLAAAVSKQSVEGATSFVLTAYISVKFERRSDW